MPLRLPKQFHPDFSRPGVKPTGAVEIDWSNPLARGLSFAVFFEGGTDRAILGHAPTMNQGTNTAQGYVQNGKQDLVYGAGDFTVTHDGTVLFDYEQVNTPHSGANVFRTNNNGIALMRSGDGFQFTSSYSRVTIHNVDAVAFFTIGAKSKVALSWRGAGERILTINGVSDTKTITSFAYADSPLTIMRYSPDSRTVYYCGGRMKYFLKFDRALSEAEKAAINEDPYQILKPAQPMMLFLPAGGTTGYTLNADVNANTLGGDGVSLLANRSLAADVNSFTLGADGVTLSSGITLVADVNTLTVGGDDVALTANRLIGADVNAITLGGDGVDLTAGWTFSADVNALTLGGDDVTLTYTSGATYTLTADAGAYTVSSDGVDLLANRLLTADARAYILSADSVTLSVGVVDTDDCYVWLQSQITDVAYTVSAINVNNYLVSDVDDTAQYLTSAFGAESIYLESCICHCE